MDLEKAKLQTMGQEKKRELEEIEAERLQIKLRRKLNYYLIGNIRIIYKV